MQKLDQAGGASGNLLQPLPVAISDKARNLAARFVQMLQQRIEKGQISRIDAIFVKRQDEAAFGRFDEKIAVLDTLGNALQRDQFADIICGANRPDTCSGPNCV